MITEMRTCKNIIRLRSILNGQVNLGKNTSVLESLITEIRTCKNFIRLRSILIRQVNLGKNTSVLESWVILLNLRGCDRMVVGFTTTYAISAYHH